jgi:drug/metabolite transporter (DMT)-like permease
MLGPELSLHGVLMGLIAAAANAAAFVVVGLIGTEVSPLNVCWWQYCVTTHAAVAVLLLTELESAVVQASSAAAAAARGPILETVVVVSSSSSSSGGGGLLAAGATAAGGVVGGLGLGLGDLQQLAQDSLMQMQDALPNQHDTLLLSGVVVANFMGQLLLNAGFQRIDAGRGAAVNTLQVVFANLWDVLLLHSQPSGGILVGLSMITAGVFGTRRSAVGEEQQQHQHQPQQQQQQREPHAS